LRSPPIKSFSDMSTLLTKVSNCSQNCNNMPRLNRKSDYENKGM
jgi:hypothetical protein